jgi:flavodoxin
MKTLIVFYSLSGNTKKVAAVLLERLKQKGEAEVMELEPKDESDKFLVQAARAFRRTRADIGPVNFDLSSYDLICLGTPVWAFGPAPAMNTYLDKCFGLEGKDVILFTTFGSGAGNERCLQYMQEELAHRGATRFKAFSIPGRKIKDKEFVLSAIEQALKQLQ